jgi:hypothetical protein
VASLISTLFAACADELGRFHARVSDLLEEADPRVALELLPDYESELDIESTGTTGERQGRVVARTIARQRYRPTDFQTALAPLLLQAGVDVEYIEILERTNAIAAAMGDVREIFRFFIYRDPALAGPYYLDAAQELADSIAPSHTKGHVIESVDFLCDDEFSLCDRDILGA